MVARVPMSDADLTKFLKEHEFTGAGSVFCGRIEDQRDFYRRVFSQDVIEGVPWEVMKELRRLSLCECGL